jgi:hypothetical protein
LRWVIILPHTNWSERTHILTDYDSP